MMSTGQGQPVDHCTEENYTIYNNNPDIFIHFFS